MVNAAEKLLLTRVYRDKELRQEVKAELRKREDVAVNGLMLLVGRLYVDGVRDGAAFGQAGSAYFTEEEREALERPA